MHKKNSTYLGVSLAALTCVVLFSACSKFLPQERETVGMDTQFTIDTYQPVLGRSTFFSNNFFKGSTTFPADFKIVNPRRRNGDAALELTNIFPVKVWKVAYTGEEKSLEEIEAKRVIQNRPIFEIGEHSGTFTMWAEGSSSFLRTQPDSGYLFDVELTNSGGRRYLRNLKLMPFRERPFEPSNYNAITGQPTSNGTTPTLTTNIKGAKTQRYLSAQDVDVYIRKISSVKGTQGHTLTFKFLDTLFRPINPDKFAGTNWEKLIHGFNMVKTTESVTYNVSYPIPAIELPTDYTNLTGTRASTRFMYNRLGFGGAVETALLGLDFAIYEPGNWEIVFAFKNDDPKFKND